MWFLFTRILLPTIDANQNCLAFNPLFFFLLFYYFLVNLSDVRWGHKHVIGSGVRWVTRHDEWPIWLIRRAGRALAKKASDYFLKKFDCCAFPHQFHPFALLFKIVYFQCLLFIIVFINICSPLSKASARFNNIRGQPTDIAPAAPRLSNFFWTTAY